LQCVAVDFVAALVHAAHDVRTQGVDAAKMCISRVLRDYVLMAAAGHWTIRKRDTDGYWRD
jgi:hypothetical protein